MKNLISVILLIALALSLIACSSHGVEIPEGMQLASNGDVAYNLFVPGGWILVDNNGIFGAYYSSSDKSSITVSSLYPTDGLFSISDYWNTLQSSYSETFKNFTVVESPKDNSSNTVFGGKAAFKYVFSADIDGVSYKFMQILSANGSLFYTFTYTSRAEDYDSHIQDVEKTITEFKFK